MFAIHTQYVGKLKVLGTYRLETAEGAIKHGQSSIRNTKTTKIKNTTQYVLDNTIPKQTNNVNRTLATVQLEVRTNRTWFLFGITI